MLLTLEAEQDPLGRGQRRSRGVGLTFTSALLKEPAVKRGFLAGITIPRLADAFGVTELVMLEYVAAHRQAWRAAEERGIHEDERRIVVFTRASRETGGVDVRPISLPRITMHLRWLEQR